jgi:AcrR family transcriptional regulator
MTAIVHRPERRAEILDIARVVLMERGVEGFTIDETALLARCSKTTLYRWWGGKAALVREAMDDKADLGSSDTGTLDGDLRVLFRGIADSQRTAGRLLLGVALAMQDDAEMAEAWRKNGFRMAAASFETIIERALARGELSSRPDTRVFYNLIPGTFIWHFAVERGAGAHDFADRFLRTVLMPALRPSLAVGTAPINR